MLDSEYLNVCARRLLAAIVGPPVVVLSSSLLSVSLIKSDECMRHPASMDPASQAWPESFKELQASMHVDLSAMVTSLMLWIFVLVGIGGYVFQQRKWGVPQGSVWAFVSGVLGSVALAALALAVFAACSVTSCLQAAKTNAVRVAVELGRPVHIAHLSDPRFEVILWGHRTS